MKKALRMVIFGCTLICLISLSPLQHLGFCQDNHDEDTYGPEETITWTKPVASVFFSHKTHTMLDAELSCEECHDDLFDMEAGAAAENENFTMASMGEGLYCGACHDGETAFAYDGPCGYCHLAPKNMVIWTKPVKTVTFSHFDHSATEEMECEACHDNLFLMKNGCTGAGGFYHGITL